jgi:hypothetical protein
VGLKVFAAVYLFLSPILNTVKLCLVSKKLFRSVVVYLFIKQFIRLEGICLRIAIARLMQAHKGEFPSPRLHTSSPPLHSHTRTLRPPAAYPRRPPPIAMPPSAAATAAAFLFPAVAIPCRVFPQRRARSLAVRAVASPPAFAVKPAPLPSKVRSSSAYSFASNVLFAGSVACLVELSALLRSLCWAVEQVAE